MTPVSENAALVQPVQCSNCSAGERAGPGHRSAWSVEAERFRSLVLWLYTPRMYLPLGMSWVRQSLLSLRGWTGTRLHLNHQARGA